MGSRKTPSMTFIGVVITVGFMVFTSSWFFAIDSQKSMRGVTNSMSDLGNYLFYDMEESAKDEPKTIRDNISSLDSAKATSFGSTTRISSQSVAVQKEAQGKAAVIVDKSNETPKTQSADLVKPSNNDKKESLPIKEASITVKETNQKSTQIEEKYPVMNGTNSSTTVQQKEITNPQATTQYSLKKEEKSPVTNITNSSTTVALKFEPDGETRCGCPLCDQVSMIHEHKGLKCGKRIDFLKNRYGASEEDSCVAASGLENDLAPCGQECNPKVCKNMTEKPLPFKPDLSNLTVSHEPFTRHDGVAIVTKIYVFNKDDGEKYIKRMICLMNAAYNRFVNYDYVIFVAMPFSKSQEKMLQDFAYPAKLTLVQEPSLDEHLANMTKDEITFLRKRCGVDDGHELSWMHHCTEENSHHVNNLAYSWQAEFRAAHIYTHPAMMNYKYMIWLDTDSWISREWEKDPIQAMVDNDLVILFDAWDYGRTSGPKLKEKMEFAYNTSICSASLNRKGHLEVNMCNEDNNPNIQQIGGFNHITNLDVYRKDVHQKFLQNMVGDYKFARQWDDQLGVTVPALYESPERSWDARANGFNFGIIHHHKVDAKENMVDETGAKKREISMYWRSVVAPKFDAGRLMCDNLFDLSKNR